MPCCCGHRYHHYLYPPGWYEAPPAPWRYAQPESERYTRMLEEERELLKRRLSQLEQELADLRRAMQAAAPRSEQS